MPATAIAHTIYIVDTDPSVREGPSRVVASAGLRPRPCGSIDAFLRETPGAGAACALLDVSTLSHCEPALWKRLQAVAAAVPVIALSAREREVVVHVIRGRLNKQIAADPDIAEQTVKQHRGRVMEKLGVRSVPELVRLCENSGFFAATTTGVPPKQDSRRFRDR